MAQKRLSLEPIKDFHVDEGDEEWDSTPIANVRKRLQVSVCLWECLWECLWG